MILKKSSLLIALAIAGSAHAAAPKARANEAATARHFATLVAGEPKSAGLTLFFSQMPKGGDLHHHYTGAIYAEQFISWIDQQGFCLDKHNYQLVTDAKAVAAQRAKQPADRSCLSSGEILADDYTYRELLQRWSTKDFYNHGAIQAPPDRHFFQTFGYALAVSGSNNKAGVLELKKRAIQENVSYIETIFELAPFTPNGDFDAKVSKAGVSDLELDEAMGNWLAALDKDAGFAKRVADYSASVNTAHAGVDDDKFTMRYQGYVLRLFNPSWVFSSMVAGFKAADSNPLLVGLNIVGQESNYVSMRDYTLHMKMFKFLRTKYPKVKLALHAGELALGDVPPDGLRSHIEEAIDTAGASRIGHGLDLAHESNAIGIMKTMRERDIPVEINLTSNGFISGITGENHPLTLYRQYGVPYVISTDDAGVTRHTLANEYVLFASRYKPDYAEVKKAAYNSLRYAFLVDADKKRLVADLDRRFTSFEAAMAALTAKPAVARKR